MERAAPAAELLRRYAALRYGSVGDESVLDQDIERCCGRLKGFRQPAGFLRYRTSRARAWQLPFSPRMQEPWSRGRSTEQLGS